MTESGDTADCVDFGGRVGIGTVMVSTAAAGRTEPGGAGTEAGTETAVDTDTGAGRDTGTAGKDTGTVGDTGTGRDTGNLGDTGTAGKDIGTGRDTGAGRDTGTLGGTGTAGKDFGAALKGLLETLGAAGTQLEIPERETKRCPECWSWTGSCRALVSAPGSQAGETAAGWPQLQAPS